MRDPSPSLSPLPAPWGTEGRTKAAAEWTHGGARQIPRWLYTSATQPARDERAHRERGSEGQWWARKMWSGFPANELRNTKITHQDDPALCVFLLILVRLSFTPFT